MKNNVSMGYSTPRHDRVTIAALIIKANGETVEYITKEELFSDIELPGWTPNSDVEVELEFHAELWAIAEDCQLSSALAQGTSGFIALIEWICPVTSFRGSSEVFRLQAGKNRVKGVIPGKKLAGSVRWFLSVVLEKNESPTEGSIAPVLAGSYLWQETGRIILEGTSSNIPTKEADFSEIKGADNRELWRLNISSDLEQHISRGILIFLNKGNKYTKKALLDIAQGKTSQVSDLWLENFELQVRVQLLQAAIAHGSEVDLEQYENADETVGQLLLRTIRMYFKEFDTSSLVAQFSKNPSLLAGFVAPHIEK